MKTLEKCMYSSQYNTDIVQGTSGGVTVSKLD